MKIKVKEIKCCAMIIMKTDEKSELWDILAQIVGRLEFLESTMHDTNPSDINSSGTRLP